MSTYKVIVNGEILPGHELEQVKQALVRLFKLNDAGKAQQTFARIFSDKPVTIKKGLQLDKAQAYQQAISQAGMGCELVAEEPPISTPPSVQGRASFEARDIEGGEGDAMATQARATQEKAQEEHNPYQQPQAELTEAADEGEFALVEPQKLGAGAGWDWIKEGYYYFKQNPLAWVASIIVFYIVLIGLSLIPLVNLAVNLIMPVFFAGFMLGCFKVYQGDSFAVGDLFSGFQNNAGTLVIVGLIYMGLTIVVAVIAVGAMFGVMGMESMVMLGQMGENADPAAVLVPILLMVLIMMALLLPVMMAYIFAPALVAIHGVSAWQSMVLSFKGCLRNILPFLVYSIMAMLLGIVAMIPLGLGFLILMPVMICSLFAAYRQIYTDTVLAV